MLEKIQEQKWFNITKLVVNILFYTLIVVLVLFSIANINKKDDFSNGKVKLVLIKKSKFLFAFNKIDSVFL